MKGYKFKVEFLVWGRESQDKAKGELQDYLLRNEEGFNIKEPEFIQEVEDPIEKLRKETRQKMILAEKKSI